MSVSTRADLAPVHLGVPAVYPGEPDGHIAGSVTVTHDGTSGTAIGLLAIGNLGEVLIRFNRIALAETGNTAITGSTQVTVIGPSALYGEAEFEVGESGLLLPARGVRAFNYPEGLWYWTGKDSGDILRMTLANVDGAVVKFTAMGWYWRMTRMRMHGPKDWRSAPWLPRITLRR